VVVKTSYDPAGNALTLQIENQGGALANLRIASAYGGEREVHFVAAGGTLTRRYALEGAFGWYDLTLTVDNDRGFRQQLAGHLETGKDSVSDPAIGGL